MNIVHIIGNGFDLNQGLPTSYAHFYEYYLQVVPTEDEPRIVSKFRALLHRKLYDNRTDKWADLEKALGEVTSEYDSVDDYMTVYKDVYKHLMAYLNMAYQHSVVEPFEDLNKTFFEDLYSPWRYLTPGDQTKLLDTLPINKDINVSIINFNYTDTLDRVSKYTMKEGGLLGRYNGFPAYYTGCRHIHHKLEGKDIILGVNNVEQVSNRKFRDDEQILTYLIKPQTNTRLETLVDEECKSLIDKADLICIYGTSLGDTDETWWLKVGMRMGSLKNACVMFLPFENNISDVLRVGYPFIRSSHKKHLLEMMDLADKGEEEKACVFVNFCNIPGQPNIFTNPKRKNLSDNFENVMAHFQKDGVIGNPKSVSALFSVTLVPPVGKDPLFIPRVYKARK